MRKNTARTPFESSFFKEAVPPTGLFSSVAEHQPRKLMVVSSNLTRGSYVPGYLFFLPAPSAVRAAATAPSLLSFFS